MSKYLFDKLAESDESYKQHLPNITNSAALPGAGLILAGEAFHSKPYTKLLEYSIKQGRRTTTDTKVYQDLLRKYTTHPFSGNTTGPVVVHQPDYPLNLSAYYPRQDVIKLGRNMVYNPGVLAHELGHSHYTDNGPGGTFGKKMHQFDNRMSLRLRGNQKMLSSATILNGMLAGKLAVKFDPDGKGNTWWANALAAAPAAAYIPLVASEAAASARGLKLIRRSPNATLSVKVKAGVPMALALGTYLAPPLATAGVGLLSKELSERANRWYDQRSR